eukprot:1020162-Rhodomonas_salina.1
MYQCRDAESELRKSGLVASEGGGHAWRDVGLYISSTVQVARVCSAQKLGGGLQTISDWREMVCGLARNLCRGPLLMAGADVRVRVRAGHES